MRFRLKIKNLKVFLAFIKDSQKGIFQKLSFKVEVKKKELVHKLKAKTISYLDVFGDGFGSFRDGVSGEFSWEDELDGRLDLS